MVGRYFLGLLWAVLLPAPWSLAADLTGLPVAEIRFEPDRQLLLESHRAGLMLVKEGEPLDRGKLGQTIRDLFATGRYAEIAVDARRAGDGVILTFLTEPSWFIGQVEVAGVLAPPSDNQLINAAKLDPGELVTQGKISRAQESIRELLEDNGYESARVEWKATDHPDTQQRDIRFEVTAGGRAGFGRIIVAGDAELSEAQIRSITHWDLDKPFTQKRLQEGIERLRRYYQKQDYWQVTARSTGFDFDSDTNRANVVIAVERGPRVQVAVEGASFSQGQLRKYLPIYEEGVVDEDLLAEGARNLRDYLQTEGYFSATVAIERETRNRNGEEEVLIVYDVNRGPRHRLVKIGIEGNRFFDLQTIRERILIREKSLQMRRGRFSQSLLDRDLAVITDLYRTNGFRDVKVSAEVTDDYGGKQDDLAVLIRIAEGPLTLVEDLEIKGSQNIPAERFYPMLASAPGQPFSEQNIATDRNLILAEYFDAGYQDASLTWKATPAAEPNRMKVEFEIREGEAVFMRDSIVSGLENTRPSLVERQIQLRKGEPLSQTAMFDTQRRLYDLGIFSKVDVALQNLEGVEPAKNVLLQMEEARRWAVSVGGGAEFGRIGGSTRDLTSPVGDISFSPRVTLEATRLNVRGIGHTLNIRTRFSDLQQRAIFAYEAPRWTGSDKWHMTLSGLLDTSRNVRTFRGRRLEGAMQLRHRLSKPSTAFYRYTFRRTSIDAATLAITPILIPLASEPVRVALFSGTYIQDRRDDPTDSTRGVYNTVDLGFASGVWGSEPDFVRVLGQNTTYHRLSSRVVLARTFQFGLMFAAGSFQEELVLQRSIEALANPDARIPLSERFYAGGANSHRGFPVNQAGPRDPTTGFPIGGGAQLLNSVELRFPLLGENIGGVLFHDAGNVYSRPGAISFQSKQRPVEVQTPVPAPARSRVQSVSPELVTLARSTAAFDFDYMVHAVGFGLRYRTPIGPIRLDLAYSVNPPRFFGFQGTREQLLGGEGTPTQQRISHFQFHFSLGQTF